MPNSEPRLVLIGRRFGQVWTLDTPDVGRWRAANNLRDALLLIRSGTGLELIGRKGTARV